jgi:2-C-methyl-D-erythritol 4-phosphate cytidylyltransferase
MPRCSAIIVGAGSSRGMEGKDKILMKIEGKPVLAWAIRQFRRHEDIDQIVVVLSPDNIERGYKIAKRYGASVCTGGERRQDSVKAGLELLRRPPENPDIVFIHDASRPCIDYDTIQRGFEMVQITGAAVATIKPRDAVSKMFGDTVLGIVDREVLAFNQTPQVFHYDVIMRAHSELNPLQNFDDDISMVLKTGVEPKTFESHPLNINITFPADVRYAACILKEMTQLRRRHLLNKK